MKFIFLLLTGWLPGIPLLSQTTHEQQRDNLICFARLYGYVKYFHPSDEAAAINWDKLAVYGAGIVQNAKNSDELLQTLQHLFHPIAPTIKIYTTATDNVFDLKLLTPPDMRGYKQVVWQHSGVALGKPGAPYKSRRVNRPYDGISFPDFKLLPRAGEYIQKEIGQNISVIVPLVLFGNEENTYPVAAPAALAALKQSLADTSNNSRNETNVRTADVIIAWNVLKHFFPYWEDASKDADTILKDALAKALADTNSVDFMRTLSLMTAPLNDGHIGVQLANIDTSLFYTVPVLFDWVESKLVVDRVLDAALKEQLSPGDIIFSIDSMSAEDLIRKKEQYISGSVQLKRSRVVMQLLTGRKNSAVTIGIQHGGKTESRTMERTVSTKLLYQERGRRHTSGEIKSGIYYIDLDKWPMDSIKMHWTEIAAARSVVCDMRGYPNSNHGFIEYLMTEKEKTLWMFIPAICYPDYQQVSFRETGWNLRPARQHLTAKVIFITDGRAISYAESYMGFIKDFKLATIVGGATAGTNGDINIIDLPGGYSISFTGMLVKNHDGSKHHLAGIVPDIIAVRTLKGVAENRDELLEKAVLLAEQ